MEKKSVVGLLAVILSFSAPPVFAAKPPTLAEMLKEKPPARVDQPESVVPNVVPDEKYADFVWTARIDRQRVIPPAPTQPASSQPSEGNSHGS